MAQGKVIDPELLYKVGASTVHIPERNRSLEQVLSFAGKLAINHLYSGYKESRVRSRQNNMLVSKT